MTSQAEPVRLLSPRETLEATFLPHLGMVGSSLRHLGEELLGQRGGPEAYAERKSTFGIPLLHPWANRLSAWGYEQGGRSVRLDRTSPVLKADPDSGLPIHGSLAASPHWEVREAGADQEKAWVKATLDYGAHPELMDVFPFAHRLDFLAQVADSQPPVEGYYGSVEASELCVRLSVTPTAEDRVPIAFGFHPYLTLPGTPREEWELSLPVDRRVVLDQQGIPTGEHQDLAPDELSGSLGDRTFDDSFDRLTDEPPVFVLADSRRRLEVRYDEGFPVAQVYAPDRSSFIAVEPMTAPVDALSSGRGLRFASPGRPFSARFSIRVSPA